MAKKVTVTLVDDFDGSGAADETVEFGLDGVTYEIDLSTKNATKLRGDLKQWVAAGRRVGGRRRGRSDPAVDVARSTASRARRSANGLVVTGTMCRREAGSRPTSSTHTTRRPDIWLPAPRRKPGRRYYRVRWRRTDGRSAPETLGWFSRLSPMRFCSTATWGAAPRNRPGTARLGTLAGRPLQWTAGTRCRPLYPMVRESR